MIHCVAINTDLWQCSVAWNGVYIPISPIHHWHTTSKTIQKVNYRWLHQRWILAFVRSYLCINCLNTGTINYIDIDDAIQNYCATYFHNRNQSHRVIQLSMFYCHPVFRKLSLAITRERSASKSPKLSHRVNALKRRNFIVKRSHWLHAVLDISATYVF